MLLKNIIRKIIESDREAREKVERVKEERQNIQSSLQSKAKDIAEEYRQQALARVSEQKTLLETSLQQHTSKAKDEYDKAVASLQEQFEANQKQWVDEIVKHCLQS